jgi:hypothetical protein
MHVVSDVHEHCKYRHLLIIRGNGGPVGERTWITQKQSENKSSQNLVQNGFNVNLFMKY